jgi:predicted nuclease with TOPRIM domain
MRPPTSISRSASGTVIDADMNGKNVAAKIQNEGAEHVGEVHLCKVRPWMQQPQNIL